MFYSMNAFLAVKASRIKQSFNMPFFPPRFKPATSVLFIYSSIHCLRNAMADAQTCFYPDGSVSTHDTPCHSPSIGDGASACCGSTDICLNNSLCLAQSGAELVTRGSCTDQTWQSPECPQYCSDGKVLLQQRRNSLHSNPHYDLVMTLILVLQKTRAAGH